MNAYKHTYLLTCFFFPVSINISSKDITKCQLIDNINEH